MNVRQKMKYERIYSGIFIERPNRFIAHIEIEGKCEIVHVKNTGRCKELLYPGVTVYVQKANNPDRKTQWDLIAVEKEVINKKKCASNDLDSATDVSIHKEKSDIKIINMDSQITNYVVKEWIEKGNLFSEIDYMRTEKTYKKSRFDLYVESKERKAFIEVKGVTLEEGGVVKFPDAPSERAVKHINELIEAVKEGYEAYIVFVIQMKDVKYFTPNRTTQPEFADALLRARAAGVQIIALDSSVTPDTIEAKEFVPVILGEPRLFELRDELVNWYECNKRELPWREDINAYRVWVSEIMLQQTRVEAVKPYYNNFLSTLPTIKDLAEVKEDKLLKLWEGLGYYNRVRNMQAAAIQIMDIYKGEFPERYDDILGLKGIGTYTAGAISSFAFNKEESAVDGNVLRVLCRVLGDETDITKASLKAKFERDIKEIIPKGKASEFNQGLIELGAIVCVPNGAPRCDVCPLSQKCVAYNENKIDTLPVKAKKKERKVEKRTILIFKDGDNVAINKRGDKGLLAKLYEFPNVDGHLTTKKVIEYSKEIGLMAIKVNKLEKSKHIFSHIEWDMIGYEVIVDELEKSCTQKYILEKPDTIEEKYPMPAAFSMYTKYININIGIK